MVQGELFAGSRELLIGPAGCGKTHRILQTYLKELEGGREQQVLLLVPTASFRDHTRNTVLRSGRVRAFSGRSVATFDDLLAQTSCAGAGREGRPELTGARRALIVRRLLRELDLPYLRNVVEFAGFRQALVEEAEEVLQAGITAQALERRPNHSHRRQAFLKFLRSYQEATAPYRQPATLDGVNTRLLLVDGFSDFTADQQRLLETLVGRAASATSRLAPFAAAAVVTLPHDAEAARGFLKRLGFQERPLEGNHRAGGSLAALESALRGEARKLPDDSAIRVITGLDRREEVERVAREILCLARDHGCRYHDIGVVVRHHEDYLPLIRDLFTRYGIPVRFFFPTAASETALGRHLLACLNLFQARTPAAVLAVLKSPYSPILKRDAVERFEYAVLENRAQAERGEWKACLGKRPFPPLEKFFSELTRFDQQLAAASDAVRLARWMIALWKAFRLLREVPAGLPHARAMEMRADALALARAFELPEEISAAAAAENQSLDFGGFADLLVGEMEQARFRVRDRRQDVVNVMNPYEARQWELRAVFVMGLVEKEFPRPAGPALFLDDTERQALGLPTQEERAQEERRLFYVAATRARERLTLSRPATGARGAPLLKSFFLEDVERLLPTPSSAPPVVEAASAAPATPRPDFLQLPATLSRVRQEQVRFSASQFKNFGQCPFKYFAEYVLRLQGPPEEAEGLSPMLQGTVVHETLREWEAGGRAEPVAEVFERVFAARTDGIPITHAEEKLRAQMRADLERFAEAEAGHSELYRTTVAPHLVEKSFGRGEGPVLEWTLADGSKVQVTGRLDRVETAEAGAGKLGVVVDFKYSKEGFNRHSLPDVEKGQEFQIPLYLLALEQGLGLEPAGAELYRLRGELERAGVFNQDLAGAIFRAPHPQETKLLPAEEFRRLLDIGRQKMEEYAGRIREGEIAVRPYDTRQCHKGGCDFYDLCRVNKWEFLKT